MKFELMKCPECGELADGTLDTVTARACFDEPDEDGNVEYCGESEMFWDGQETVCEKNDKGEELATLLCHNGHDWKTKVITWQ